MDNHLFLYDYNTLIKMNHGLQLVTGITGGYRLLSMLDMTKYGVEHTGMLGDVVIGSYLNPKTDYSNQICIGAYSKRIIPYIAVAAVFLPMIFIHSCANTTQAPTGGDKDTIPPVIVDIKPLPGTVNVPVHGTKFIFTFDEYVQFCLDCGLGPDISCYSLCPWKLKEKPGTPEFEARWAPFLKRFTAHLKEKGWYERTLMAMDERDPDQVRAIVDFVHRHAPGMRISMAGNRKPSDFAGIDIDVYAQGLRKGADGKDFISAAFLGEVTARRKRGFVTTHYVCCHPPRPNTFLSSDTEEAFWLGAYPAMVGLDGFLRWAWNSWPENPYEDATFGNWASGDTFLCYPDGSPSIRFLELRNGIIAAEKVRILREAGLFKEELDKVAALYKSSSAIDGSCDFWRIRQETLKAVNLSVR